MNSESSSQKRPVSGAKLAANRANAQKSCGPRNPENSRFNAVKHGLTSRVAWTGKNQQRSEEFFKYGQKCLQPRDALEEVHVRNLLNSRLSEDLLLEVERTIITRRPLFDPADEGRVFMFLHDADGLTALDQLVRHITHYTRVSQKQFLALITARKEYLNNHRASAGYAASSDALDAVSTSPSEEPPEATRGNPVNRGTLKDCLMESRLILPDEDMESYRSLVSGLWARFQPANLLEGFVVADFVQAQWRLDRAFRLQSVVFERGAVSATGRDCGLAFGFIHDVQRCQALESLRKYEMSLQKRQESRLAFLQKLKEASRMESNTVDTSGKN